MFCRCGKSFSCFGMGCTPLCSAVKREAVQSSVQNMPELTYKNRLSGVIHKKSDPPLFNLLCLSDSQKNLAYRNAAYKIDLGS